MRIITKRQRIHGVLESWKRQYPNNKFTQERHKEITRILEKLDFNVVDERTIIDIIGNDTWTALNCDECGKNKDIIIRFLERNENEYEANSCDLCLECLNKGSSLIKEFAISESGEQ